MCSRRPPLAAPRGALTSALLAFLDVQLKGRGAGAAWLDSGNLAATSDGGFTIERR